jgi:hypothetical protein
VLWLFRALFLKEAMPTAKIKCVPGLATPSKS